MALKMSLSIPLNMLSFVPLLKYGIYFFIYPVHTIASLSLPKALFISRTIHVNIRFEHLAQRDNFV